MRLKSIGDSVRTRRDQSLLAHCSLLLCGVRLLQEAQAGEAVQAEQQEQELRDAWSAKRAEALETAVLKLASAHEPKPVQPKVLIALVAAPVPW